MRREYYLHKRKNGIFYVEYVNPENGKKLTARSTGKKDRIEARVQAELWIANGIPTGRKRNPRPLEEAARIESIIKAIRRADLNSDDALRVVESLKNLGLIDIAAVKNTGRGAVPFIQFLESFWDYDKSEYIRDRLAHGFGFTRRYTRECQKRLSKDIVPFFGDKKLNCVTTDDLQKLTNKLADRGLATSTINQALLICKTPLKWAFEKKIIPENPAVGLTRFSIKSEKRGILTESETEAVFVVEWKDKRAFVASLLVATTGARQGECLALRRSDIGTDQINIAHSYSPLDGGLKCPKNGETRTVPLLPEVRAALLDLLDDNPHEGIPDPYIFYSMRPDKPTDPQIILEGLKNALKKINVDYKARKIHFHSWRHWFCSKLTEIIEGEKVAKVSGHLSEAVLKKYADHIEIKNIQEVRKAAAQAFESVLQFKKGV